VQQLKTVVVDHLKPFSKLNQWQRFLNENEEKPLWLKTVMLGKYKKTVVFMALPLEKKPLR
jgi:hypothetical protein